MDLDQIVALLNQFHRRATFGAIAAYLTQHGQQVFPRFLMDGRDRNHLNSWVVNQVTGLPTNYGPTQMHPHLLQNATVLTTAPQLTAWLQNPTT
jgi:hypothetical protein